MHQNAPILDYAQSPALKRLPWQAVVAIPVMLLSSVTVCLCGHMNGYSLPFTLTATFFACWGTARHDLRPIWRISSILIALLAAGFLMKNAADILWLGHDPLL